MLLNVEENLIGESRSSTMIENEIEDYLETNEGQNIKVDINLLIEMGFAKKMIDKVYILLRPENIERAIDYMTEIDGIYQHNYLASTNPKENNLCFICKKPKQNHLDYIEDDLMFENQNNNEQNYLDKNENDMVNDEDKAEGECGLCYEKISKKDKSNNTLPCGDLYCNHCWFNYLKTLISESKVDEIKCMNHECYDIIPEKFILKHISNDEHLLEKYKRFKKRVEIFKDKNKKICPNPDCDSFLQKSELTKYVQCENGHEYCFECLKPPHGDEQCNYNIDKQFMEWKEGKRVKRCPRCKMYTEKNEGCNHMTCVTCKYQWCWLCEGPYNYGHYDSGKCAGHQFTRADNLDEIKKNNYYQPYYLDYNIAGPSEYFGLHKVFPCVFEILPTYGRPNIMEVNFIVRYLIMLLFWFFGVFFIFITKIFDFFTDEDFLADGCVEYTMNTIVVLTGICLFAAYQILFSCIVTPVMLISFFYHKFFDDVQLFFELS